MEYIVTKNNPFTTYINRFELLCGAREDEETAVIKDCLTGFIILPFDDLSSHEAARIYKELKGQGQFIGIREEI